MDYLHHHFNERTDPGVLLAGTRSLVVVGLSYNQPPAPPADNDAKAHGRVAMYAWGDDYHRVLKRKLFALADRLHDTWKEPFDSKVCVDTAPILEREAAAAAGIGWIGKNTLILNESHGSYFFLGVLLLTVELAPDEPTGNHCGSCRACLDACPTQAFTAPHQMDAQRCISYLTIEHRGAISSAFADKMDDWIFGCDVCQEVCPFNSDAPTTNEPRFAARENLPRPSLDELIEWSEDDYDANLRGSAMRRAKLPMLKRNADIAKRNQERNAPND